MYLNSELLLPDTEILLISKVAAPSFVIVTSTVSNCSQSKVFIFFIEVKIEGLFLIPSPNN